MLRLLATLLAARLALASPHDLVARQACGDLAAELAADPSATPFCEALICIPTTTSSTTFYSTQDPTTITVSTSSVETSTTTVTTTFLGITTIGYVSDVYTTSTCSFSSPTEVAAKVRRDDGSSCSVDNIATPTELASFAPTALSSACSCLNLADVTQYDAVTVTTTPTPTVTITSASTQDVVVTTTTTLTSWTSTDSILVGTNTHTSTALPAAATTLSYAGSSSFGFYDNNDFPGNDIANFFCYPGGAAPPFPYPSCSSFLDCIAACEYYNDNDLGNGVKCGAVGYNSRSDQCSGSCYLKTGTGGCGSPNSLVDTAVLM